MLLGSQPLLKMLLGSWRPNFRIFLKFWDFRGNFGFQTSWHQTSRCSRHPEMVPNSAYWCFAETVQGILKKLSQKMFTLKKTPKSRFFYPQIFKDRIFFLFFCEPSSSFRKCFLYFGNSSISAFQRCAARLLTPSGRWERSFWKNINILFWTKFY